MKKLMNAFYDSRVLVTGGLGFIGSNLARHLIKLGAHVEIVDSLIPEHGGNVFNVSDIAQDIRIYKFNMQDNPEELSNIISRQNFLFNLAGQSSHLDSMVNPHADLEYNCRAHLSLLESVRKVNPEVKIVYTSTRQIYGKPRYLPVDEKHPVCPVDINGIHKASGELYHTLYGQVYGLRSVILRLTNTIGPRMRIRDARQTFLGYWIRCAIESRPFEVWGGQQLRDINYVDDVVDALLIAATSKQAFCRIYNLGASPPSTLIKIAKLLSDISGCNYIIRDFPEGRKNIDIGDYYAKYDLIKEDLGWIPRTPLVTALEKTVEYYRKYIEHYV